MQSLSWRYSAIDCSGWRKRCVSAETIINEHEYHRGYDGDPDYLHGNKAKIRGCEDRLNTVWHSS